MSHRWTASFAYNLVQALGWRIVERDISSVGREVVLEGQRRLFGLPWERLHYQLPRMSHR